jgi:hypothetical protein
MSATLAEMEERQQELVSQRDQAEDDAAFYKAMFARARCGCIQRDCTLHGAWAAEDIDRLMAAGLLSPREASR